MQCQATNKKTGEQCRRRAVQNKRVCTVHGGLTPGGIASPHFKTGEYSKYALPLRMRERYEASLNDPALLEQRREISLVDARLQDLLARVDTGESGALWKGLQDARVELLACRKAGDVLGQTLALNRILDFISQAHADYRAWAEVGAALEQRRKLVESERKRLVEAQQVITTEQAMLFANAILTSIHTHVQDRAVLTAIQADVTRLLNRDIIDVSTTEE